MATATNRAPSAVSPPHGSTGTVTPSVRTAASASRPNLGTPRTNVPAIKMRSGSTTDLKNAAGAKGGGKGGKRTTAHGPTRPTRPAPKPVTQAELTRDLTNIEKQLAAMSKAETTTATELATDEANAGQTPSSTSGGISGVLGGLTSSPWLIAGVAAIGLGAWYLYRRHKQKTGAK